MKQCEECGTEFEPKRPVARFCSMHCSHVANGRRGAAVKAATTATYKARFDMAIEVLWRDGRTETEISVSIGVPVGFVNSRIVLMRRRGVDLPFHREPKGADTWSDADSFPLPRYAVVTEPKKVKVTRGSKYPVPPGGYRSAATRGPAPWPPGNDGKTAVW